jgi:hypothetical protein
MSTIFDLPEDEQDWGRWGQRAYEAYSSHAAGLSVDGKELPEWDQLPGKIRAHWIYAIQAVLSEAIG